MIKRLCKIPENLNDALIVKNKDHYLLFCSFIEGGCEYLSFFNSVVSVIKTGQSNGGKTAEIIFL